MPEDLATPGTLLWFLVTASNPFGEGTAGAGSAGPRLIDSSGDCAAGATLVTKAGGFGRLDSLASIAGALTRWRTVSAA